MSYINREALLAEYDRQHKGPPGGARKIIETFPAADVREVRRGRWQITDCYPHNVYCSECHTRFAQTHWAVWEDGSLPRNFCPNCGALMEEQT